MRTHSTFNGANVSRLHSSGRLCFSASEAGHTAICATVLLSCVAIHNVGRVKELSRTANDRALRLDLPSPDQCHMMDTTLFVYMNEILCTCTYVYLQPTQIHLSGSIYGAIL